MSIIKRLLSGNRDTMAPLQQQRYYGGSSSFSQFAPPIGKKSVSSWTQLGEAIDE
jgi:hypothetical protein